jgi:hypothetical protein
MHLLSPGAVDDFETVWERANKFLAAVSNRLSL